VIQACLIASRREFPAPPLSSSTCTSIFGEVGCTPVCTAPLGSQAYEKVKTGTEPNIELITFVLLIWNISPYIVYLTKHKKHNLNVYTYFISIVSYIIYDFIYCSDYLSQQEICICSRST
jgi:hypothetical protein